MPYFISQNLISIGQSDTLCLLHYSKISSLSKVCPCKCHPSLEFDFLQNRRHTLCIKYALTLQKLRSNPKSLSFRLLQIFPIMHDFRSTRKTVSRHSNLYLSAPDVQKNLLDSTPICWGLTSVRINISPYSPQQHRGFLVFYLTSWVRFCTINPSSFDIDPQHDSQWRLKENTYLPQ